MKGFVFWKWYGLALTPFLKLADELEKDIDECARLETIEMWMLNHISKAWLQKTANLIRWFSNNIEKTLWEKEFETSDWIKWKEVYDSIWVIFWKNSVHHGLPPMQQVL